MLHLRYFVAVAEELNFSAAARKLHMAASPLSQRIKDLEHELGQKLFDRSTHHVTLTPAGSALLPIARDVLEQVNSIPWRLREAAKSQRSTVFLGMPNGVHPDRRGRPGRRLRREGLHRAVRADWALLCRFTRRIDAHLFRTARPSIERTGHQETHPIEQHRLWRCFGSHFLRARVLHFDAGREKSDARLPA